MVTSIPVPVVRPLAEKLIGVRGKKVLKSAILRAKKALGGEPFTTLTVSFSRIYLRHLAIY